ncbi:hypothetical protein [Amycolatopsis sp. 195334CR]|uniref:hypothetical protein n=1 Tax=Amycolatopsis sp. 195334CR TaxID=2814588 RepID=UPI001A8D1F4C|nr:hypothetical protein [Amycolatopsis sp. 195334CR]MBN6040574.1 hypothetical protein [Amycolatopsis sp. 195334CR]
MRRFMAPVLVGLVAVVAFGVWWGVNRHTATPEVIEGWAMPDAAGTTISLHDSDDSREGNSYIVVGAYWADHTNLWHDGTGGPTCVGTDTTKKTRVRLGIVDAEPHEGPGGPRVVWLRCLS